MSISESVGMTFKGLTGSKQSDSLRTCLHQIFYTRLAYSFVFNFKFGFSSMAPFSAGIRAPLGGWFFDLKSSQICSMVFHSTPSCVLMYSMIL